MFFKQCQSNQQRGIESRELILKTLEKHTEISRQELLRQTNLSLKQIRHNTSHLVMAGKVKSWKEGHARFYKLVAAISLMMISIELSIQFIQATHNEKHAHVMAADNPR